MKPFLSLLFPLLAAGCGRSGETFPPPQIGVHGLDIVVETALPEGWTASRWQADPDLYYITMEVDKESFGLLPLEFRFCLDTGRLEVRDGMGLRHEGEVRVVTPALPPQTLRLVFDLPYGRLFDGYPHFERPFSARFAFVRASAERERRQKLPVPPGTNDTNPPEGWLSYQ